MASFDDRLDRLSRRCDEMRRGLDLARQEPPAAAAAMLKDLERELGLVIEELDDLRYTATTATRSNTTTKKNDE